MPVAAWSSGAPILTAHSSFPATAVVAEISHAMTGGLEK